MKNQLRISWMLIGIVILLSFLPKNPPKNFKVELRHFYGAEGYIVHYFLDQDSLKLRYNCDFSGCKDTLLYQISLEREKTAAFYSYLTSMRYDTLKNTYEGGGSDGRFSMIKIAGDSLPVKEIRLERYRHESIEHLIDEVDLMIPDIRYRLYRHKYKKD